ncbi:MAG TPA: DUF1080 domain-containing protein [Verrucomicrobia bacterium]|nr:DUF1080 domain-containing protein [Verrucomicrobiota bacterium]
MTFQHLFQISPFKRLIPFLIGITALLGLDLFSQESGFKPIFDGKTLNGWDGNPAFWTVKEGALTGQTTSEKPTQGNTFLVWRHGEIDDFELKLEYRIVGGNSGIQYRSFEKPEEWGQYVVGGYQADIDSGTTWSGTLYGERFRGVLAKRGQKTTIGSNHKPDETGIIGNPEVLQSKIHSEQWNEYHIIAKGFQFIQKINGIVMSESLDEDKEMRRRSGILALQLHAGPPMKVQFRNIRLKRLRMDDQKKIVLVSGHRSHGYGSHEFNAGNLLLANALNTNMHQVHASVYLKGWPIDPTAFDNADAIVLFMNGGKGHLAIHENRLDEIGKLMNQGVGLACLHYGVEVPKEQGGKEFLDWIGGYFEAHWSVNPHWNLTHPQLATNHPITRGVGTFECNDEWYYHMRFRENMEGVTPILSAIPPESTLSRPDGPHSGNPHVRAEKGQPQILAWARERPDGGRGFGFTGGHYHWNWANDPFRKMILNALAWTAGAEIPAKGIISPTPSIEELEKNQDYTPSKKFNRAEMIEKIRRMNR